MTTHTDAEVARLMLEMSKMNAELLKEKKALKKQIDDFEHPDYKRGIMRYLLQNCDQEGIYLAKDGEEITYSKKMKLVHICGGKHINK